MRTQRILSNMIWLFMVMLLVICFAAANAQVHRINTDARVIGELQVLDSVKTRTGYYYSSDGGVTWSPVGDTLWSASGGVLSPATEDTVEAVYVRSTDGYSMVSDSSSIGYFDTGSGIAYHHSVTGLDGVIGGYAVFREYGTDGLQTMFTNDLYGIGDRTEFLSSKRVIRMQGDTAKVTSTVFQVFGRAAMENISLSDCDTIASSSTITLGDANNVFITGTADIDSISVLSGTRPFQIVTLVFGGTAATNGVVDGENIYLESSMGYLPTATLVLQRRGSFFYELSRSNNGNP